MQHSAIIDKLGGDKGERRVLACLRFPRLHQEGPATTKIESEVRINDVGAR